MLDEQRTSFRRCRNGGTRSKNIQRIQILAELGLAARETVKSQFVRRYADIELPRRTSPAAAIAVLEHAQ